MYKIDGKKIEELTMFDRLDEWKQVLNTLSERDYIKCIDLNLNDENPYIEYETDDDNRVYDDINEITDEIKYRKKKLIYKFFSILFSFYLVWSY